MPRGYLFFYSSFDQKAPNRRSYAHLAPPLLPEVAGVEDDPCMFHSISSIVFRYMISFICFSEHI